MRKIDRLNELAVSFGKTKTGYSAAIRTKKATYAAGVDRSGVSTYKSTGKGERRSNYNIRFGGQPSEISRLSREKKDHVKSQIGSMNVSGYSDQKTREYDSRIKSAHAKTFANRIHQTKSRTFGK